MKRNFFLGQVAGLIAGAGVLAASPAWAAFGDLDTTFGSGAVPGFSIHNLGGDGDLGLDIVTGAGDRLYALGLKCNGTGSACLADAANRLVLTRYTADGIVDPGFGSAGDLVLRNTVNTFDFRVEVDDPHNLIYLATVLCNPSQCGIVIQRTNFSDTPDQSYGNGGTVIVPTLFNNPYVVQLLLQPNGKLLVLIEHDTVDNAGAITQRRFNVVRLNADGSPDTGWGNGGTVDVSTPGGCDLGDSLVLGRATLYVIGAQSSSCTGTYLPSARRYRADGTLDPTFGSGGQVTSTYGQTGDFIALALQEQPDGKIAYGIGTVSGQNFNIDIVMLNSDGTRDASFTPEHGSVVQPTNFLWTGNAQFQTTGKLVFNGQYRATPPSSPADEALERRLGSPLFAHPPRFTPFVRFDQVADSVNEDAGTASIKVELCANATGNCIPVTSPQPITVPFTLGGDATRGLDYNVADSVTIPANTPSANIVVTIIDDTDEEFSEAILFSLGNVTGAQAGTTSNSFILGIVDDDLAPREPPSTSDGGALEIEMLAALFGLMGLRRARSRRR